MRIGRRQRATEQLVDASDDVAAVHHGGLPNAVDAELVTAVFGDQPAELSERSTEPPMDKLPGSEASSNAEADDVRALLQSVLAEQRSNKQQLQQLRADLVDARRALADLREGRPSVPLLATSETTDGGSSGAPQANKNIAHAGPVGGFACNGRGAAINRHRTSPGNYRQPGRAAVVPVDQLGAPTTFGDHNPRNADLVACLDSPCLAGNSSRHRLSASCHLLSGHPYRLAAQADLSAVQAHLVADAEGGGGKVASFASGPGAGTAAETSMCRCVGSAAISMVGDSPLCRDLRCARSHRARCRPRYHCGNLLIVALMRLTPIGLPREGNDRKRRLMDSGALMHWSLTGAIESKGTTS